MSVARKPMAGSFAEPLDELLPLLAVPPHQIAAAVFPDSSTRQLTKPRNSGRTLERMINERLSDRGIH